VADNLTTLIEVEAFAKILNSDSGIFVFDCRFSLTDDQYGHRGFAENHIPTAQYADLNQQMSADIIPGKTGRHPLPAKEVFLQQVQDWGVGPDALIVAYDDSNGVYASRLWWMFRWLGHANVVVLNGGIQAWNEAGYEVTSDIPRYTRSNFKISPSLTLSIEAGEVLLDSGFLADARELPRFKGEVEPIDPVAGHIPGASCLPFAENMSAGKFKSADELKNRFNSAGIEEGTHVTCYCGSGVTAAHNILALVHAGFPEPTLYAGSWSEWITDPERPIATGD
jgi:thiosulfate/3-mercaptopyruvate sulfurtransferase